MPIKMQRVALLEVFHHAARTKFIEKLADMFDRFAEFINGLNADTATRQISQKSSPESFSFDFVPVSS